MKQAMGTKQKAVGEVKPFHGGNRGSNPRGDANHQIIKLAQYPRLERKDGLPASSRLILASPSGNKVFPSRPGKKLGKGAA
jgi:hypothetical protein